MVLSTLGIIVPLLASRLGTLIGPFKGTTVVVVGIFLLMVPSMSCSVTGST